MTLLSPLPADPTVFKSVSIFKGPILENPPLLTLSFIFWKHGFPYNYLSVNRANTSHGHTESV